MDMNCTGVQLNGGVGLRVGKCQDKDGNTYIDWGVSVGPQVGLMVFWGKDTRASEFEIEGRASLGLIVAGEASTVNSNMGVGLGGGLGVGIRGAVPYGVRTRPSGK